MTTKGDQSFLLSLDGYYFTRREIFDPNWLEPFEMKLLSELSYSADVFCDVGANVGYYSVALGALRGDAIRIDSFEPDPKNYRALCNNMAINNVVAKHALNNVAVSDKADVLDFFISEDNAGDHRVFFVPGEIRQNIKVNAITLDEYYSGQSIRNLLLKLDIQGAEYQALQGAKNTLSQVKGSLAIAMEFWPSGLSLGGVEVSSMLDLMEQIGGDIYLIDEHSSKLYSVNRSWIEEFVRDVISIETKRFTNFLLLRDRPPFRTSVANCF